MTRPALLLFAAIAVLVLSACGGANSDSNASSNGSDAPPFAKEELTAFKGAGDCLTLSYPTGWQIETKGDLTGAGTDYCPGGNLTASKVVECNAAAVAQQVGLVRVSAPPDSGETAAPARIEVDASQQRCPTLKDHFDQILAAEQGNATDISPASDTTIAGYPARCATMTFAGTPENYSANVCAFAAGTSIYNMSEEVAESRISDLKPALEQILGTLQLKPIRQPGEASSGASAAP